KKQQQILALKGAKSAPGATFSILQAKQKKVTNNSITISWKKANGAKSYIVYGSKSGKTDKYVQLKTVTGTSFTQKKLKKGTYYKYIVVAVGNGKALATSKTLYIATKGGKVGNYKTITTGASDNKVNIKVGKTFKLQAAAKAESTKLKVKKFRALTYESSNKAVATVSNKGVIKAVGKGTCDVYVYAQNGVLVKIKVKVK
ncbi:MAG: fibronectin type III domain-containing protein, partial [Lachnospiraceae bacterium]|nr:fibronectin type III domain-containing protein [Lachnospiraceae bacterium]